MAQNLFMIENTSANKIQIFWEPLGLLSIIGSGKSVKVCEEFEVSPLTIQCKVGVDGNFLLSVWAGDGELKVTFEDLDLMELMVAGGGVFDSSNF